MKLLSILAVFACLFVSQNHAFGNWGAWAARLQAEHEARVAAAQAHIAAVLAQAQQVAEAVAEAIPIKLIIDEEKINNYVSGVLEKAGQVKDCAEDTADAVTTFIVNSLQAFRSFVDGLLALLPTIQATVTAKIDAIAAVLKSRLSKIYALKLKLKAQIKIELAEWKEEAEANLVTFRANLKTKLAELKECHEDKKEDLENDIAALRVKIDALVAEVSEKVGDALEILVPQVQNALTKLQVLVEQSTDLICDCVQDELDGLTDVVCDAANVMLYQSVGVRVQNAAAEMICDIRDNIIEGQKEVESIIVFENPSQWLGFREPGLDFGYQPKALPVQYVEQPAAAVSNATLIIAILVMTFCAGLGTVLYLKAKRDNAARLDTEYKV